MNKKIETSNSPLVTIIKLNAAEALLDLDEAKKYQDINRIYKNSTDEKKSPEEYWKGYISSLNNLQKSKIFTNQWKYFDYDISEITEGSHAEVILKSKNPDDNLQAIEYELELRKSAWIVTKIGYKKREK